MTLKIDTEADVYFELRPFSYQREVSIHLTTGSSRFFKRRVGCRAMTFPRRKDLEVINHPKIKRIKKEAIRYLRCVKECERQLRKLKRALAFITIPDNGGGD